ncbi:gfo/Idh/MocA family oxidoreductase [Arachnia propionica]|uniref:Gfo/Idh/MocA family oxidoreductase n=1 Tax=Arachnia propionica TaxID=1750 RepID=A0A3P1T6N2_9ACTN|nr:Gfo/Idh/MocA family oxidoreductase [Arachnia propionica]RRD05177.1 gfo/Idh/MocA family oxidoreductase [Arachnia propionica]
MTQQSPLRFGILGAGMIAGDEDGYLPNLSGLTDKVEVVAVADVVPDHAEHTARRFGIDTVHASLAEMLRDDRVEAVANLTPISVHAETSMSILRSGRHLLSEKPLATTVAEADALIEEATRQSVVVVCAPPDTLYAQYQEARRIIDQGRIGKVCFARVRSSHAGPGGGPDGWPFDPTWFYQPGGGPLFDMGVYGIHEITSLLGPARRVSAFGGITEDIRTVRGTGPFGGLEIPVTTPDNFLFMLDFGDSTYAVIDATFNVLATRAPKVEVFGRRGALAIHHRDTNPLEVFVQDLEPGVDAWLDPRELTRAENLREQELHRAMLMEHLVDCVRTGQPPIADAHRARHALEVMTAAVESAATGRVVDLTTTFRTPHAR